MGTPMFIGLVVEAIANKDYDAISNLALYWLIFIAAASIFSSTGVYLYSCVTQEIGFAMRQELFQ